MTMNFDDPARLTGTPVIGGDGEKLGNVDAVYYDNATDRAEWVAVRSGLFGTRVALVPLRSSDYAGDTLRVPFDKVQLRNAPHHDPGRELSPSDEADLYRYYGIDYHVDQDADRAADHGVQHGVQHGVEHGTRQATNRAPGADAAVQTVELAPGALSGVARPRRDDAMSQDRGRLRREHATVTEPVERVRLAREQHAADRRDDTDLRERRSI